MHADGMEPQGWRWIHKQWTWCLYVKWIMSKRPIASKQLGIMAVICSSITAKGPVQTNNPHHISATFYALGICFSRASSHHCFLRIATYGPTQWIWKRESQYIPTKISLTNTSSPKKLEQKRYLPRNKKCYTSPAWIISHQQTITYMLLKQPVHFWGEGGLGCTSWAGEEITIRYRTLK